MIVKIKLFLNFLIIFLYYKYLFLVFEPAGSHDPISLAGPRHCFCVPCRAGAHVRARPVFDRNSLPRQVQLIPQLVFLVNSSRTGKSEGERQDQCEFAAPWTILYSLLEQIIQGNFRVEESSNNINNTTDETRHITCKNAYTVMNITKKNSELPPLTKGKEISISNLKSRM